MNSVKARIEEAIKYITDIKSTILVQNPISRCDFNIHEEIIQKYITLNCSADEIESSKDLYDNNYHLLNQDQKHIIDTIINENAIIKNYCILGKAGTGKTFMLYTLMAYFRANNIAYGVAASTGIAAVLIKGRTLHSMFSLYIRDEDIHCGLTLSDNQGQAVVLMQYLFINEVTMLNAKVFNVINKKLKYLRMQKYGDICNHPFGGVKLILTGDLAQVPAVIKNRHGDVDEAKNMFTSMNDFDTFEIMQLTINQRQNNDDEDFIYLLNEVREHENGKRLSEKSLDMLKSVFLEGGMKAETLNIVSDFVKDEGLVVFYTNYFLDSYNNDMLAKLYGTEIKEYEGLFIVQPQNSYLSNNGDQNMFCFKNASEKEVSYMKHHLKRNSNLVPVNLKIAKGCKVMLLKNINTSRGLVNGRTGEVIDIFCNKENNFNTMLIIRFKKITSDDEDLVVEIGKQLIEKTDLPNGSTISFYQFPIKLCYGVTAHKVQGQTLKKVAINISMDAFAHGSFYVALSRVRNLQDVMLFGPEKFPEDGPNFHNNSVIQTIGNEFQMMISKE